jgi:RNA polymerase sigma-70 factor (ECF subfamily)
LEPETKHLRGKVEKWIDLARQGDREALGNLLENCRRHLLFLAQQRLSPVLSSKVAPSDVVQETLMEAGRDFLGFRGTTEQELLGWLGRILRNNVSNIHRYFRAEKRRVDREISLESCMADALLHRAIRQVETPSSHMQAHERGEQMTKAVRLLPEHYRLVLFWHTVKGQSFVQLAETLGGTADAVRKLWGRAIKELTRLLDTSSEIT